MVTLSYLTLGFLQLSEYLWDILWSCHHFLSLLFFIIFPSHKYITKFMITDHSSMMSRFHHLAENMHCSFLYSLIYVYFYLFLRILGWSRVDFVFKCTFSWRGHRFNFQCLHDICQISLTSVPGSLTSIGIRPLHGAYAYMQAKCWYT